MADSDNDDDVPTLVPITKEVCSASEKCVSPSATGAMYSKMKIPVTIITGYLGTISHVCC